jgi:hypothetical protein
MVPLWGLVPEVAIYNTAVLLALTITAYGTFRLVRELTGDAAVAFATGTIFTAVPYQFAHLQGHLHLLAMGWLPLYLLHLLRVLDGRGRLADGVLGGMFLALASLASWYHLLYALVLTPVLVAHALLVRPRTVLAGSTVRAMLALAATWLAMVGPLVVAMLVARGREPFTGAHDALTFSADLHSFVFPNAAQRWSGLFGAHWRRWSGNTTENATYVGVTLGALAVVGAIGNARARAFQVAAAIGAVLALGPRLHVDGAVLPTTLPYAYLERALPLLRFTGVPIRFGYVMYLGLAVAAGFGLVRLRRSLGLPAVVTATALALLEYYPRPLITWDYGVPAPMRAWAADPTPFAVLDVWDYYRPMWHATIHRKPMVGGYLTRVPKRLEDAFYAHPVVRAVLEGGGSHVVRRTDPAVDFAWTDAAPDASLVSSVPFTARWSGTLVAPASGRYELRLEADDAARGTVSGNGRLRRARDGRARGRRARARRLLRAPCRRRDDTPRVAAARRDAGRRADGRAPHGGRRTGSRRRVRAGGRPLLRARTRGRPGRAPRARRPLRDHERAPQPVRRAGARVAARLPRRRRPHLRGPGRVTRAGSLAVASAVEFRSPATPHRERSPFRPGRAISSRWQTRSSSRARPSTAGAPSASWCSPIRSRRCWTARSPASTATPAAASTPIERRRPAAAKPPAGRANPRAPRSRRPPSRTTSRRSSGGGRRRRRVPTRPRNGSRPAR